MSTTAAAEASGLQVEALPRDGREPALELVSSGPAPRFLFLHGSSGQAMIWAPLLLAMAARGVHGAALSFRGHGGSEGRRMLQSYRILDYEADTKRALQAMQSAPILVGHSMGGLVAQLVAEELPLPGLALLASSPVGGMQKDGLRMLLRQPRAFLRAMRRRSFKSLYEKEETTRWLLFSRDAPAELVRRYQAEAQEESWLAGAEMNTMLPAPGRVRCPVMVMGGEEDNMVCPASVRRTAQAYGVEPEFFPRCGHMLQLECEAGALAERLIAFAASR